MAFPSPWSFRIPRPVALLPLLLLASRAPAPAVHVLRVGPSRPFATIQAAVDAASGVDVVLVDPGAYSGFSIDGKGGAVVVDSGTAHVSGAIDVDHVGIGQICLLADLQGAATSTEGFALQIRHSAGSIRVQNSTFAGKDVTTYAYLPAGTGANVAFSGDVVLTQCAVRGGHGATEHDASISGGLGLFARSSGLRLFASSFAGGHGSSDDSGDAWDGGNGGHGLETPEGLTFASECTFAGGYGGQGGEGYDPFDCIDGGRGGSGGDGIRVGSTPPGTGSPVVQLLGSTTGGGAPGGGGYSQCGSAGAPGQPGQPVAVNNGSSVILTDASRRMEGPSVAREAGLLPLTFRGVAGDEVRLDFERGNLGPWSPGHVGRVARPGLRSLDVGTIPPGGVLVVQFPIPDLGPGVEARAVLMTPVFVDSNGAEHAGNSFAVVLLDASI